MVQVGDVVNEPYDDAQWRDMFRAMGMTAGSRNWLVSIGNHEQCVLIDCDSNGAEAFRSYFDWPDNGYPEQGETWFFTDYQGVRFVVLDSFGGQIVEQADFLEEALRTNPSDWSVVVQHTPAFSARPDRTNQEIRDLWVPIVERYDVDLVLTGHDHSYARGFLNVGRGWADVCGLGIWAEVLSGHATGLDPQRSDPGGQRCPYADLPGDHRRRPQPLVSGRRGRHGHPSPRGSGGGADPR